MNKSEKLELIVAEQELCSRSLSTFTRAAWHIIEPGTQFVSGFHIDALSEHLTAVLLGQLRDLIINIPPRHMKSILTSVMFPAFAWIKLPHLRWLFSSYAASLSIRDSVKCRRIIQSPWYQARFGHIYQLTSDQNAKEKYENNMTGHRIATSVDGAGTGEGGDIIVVDDPHKVSETESDTMRQRVIDWWDGEMTSRGNDPKKVAKIIIMQRIHERDLSGHLLAKASGWEHLCLPGEYESARKKRTVIGWEDPRKTEGQLLWPERFGASELNKLKAELGSQRSAGQIQQRPAPAEGNIFKRPHFQFYKELPTDIDFMALSVDLSFDAGATNSFAVFQVWGRRQAQKYLIDQVRAQMAFPQQLMTFRALCAKWRNLNAKWVEKKANGDALISTVQAEIPGVIAVTPKGSKEARAEAVSPQFEAGNIFLPDPTIAPWINDYIEEMVTFPNAANDDQVDATTQAVSKLTQTVSFEWVPISMTKASVWK